ncbi:hypothetical protein LMG29739_05681 [Paraburkholderia solisilvae]|uniref:Uncharacterized protein n=1 Tax=Paraburkholderia solisilvae TaxID=624376 RepID=A0A6J5EXN9_9BURK|nr:hypothetical protein LMG29739_05681 [Paraburkholderia solisilvae]
MAGNEDHGNLHAFGANTPLYSKPALPLQAKIHYKTCWRFLHAGDEELPGFGKYFYSNSNGLHQTRH